MTEKIESDFQKDFKELLKVMVSLCPAYNSVSRVLRDCKDKPIGIASIAYPDLFDPKITPVLIGIFGLNMGVNVNVSSGTLGYDLLSLINRLEEYLDKEDIRKLLIRAFEMEFPNPARVYVELCVTTLKDKDVDALKLLRELSQLNYSDFDTLIKNIKEHYGLDLDKKRLLELLWKLSDLGLFSDFRENYVRVKEIYRRHIIDLAQI
jgi:hypothetical protein